MQTKLFEKLYPSHTSQVQVGSTVFGKDFPLIAGPCAVEDRSSLSDLESAMGSIDIIRGGVFKSRTSPYSFSGLGEPGLDIMAQMASRYNKPIVVEFIQPEQVDFSQRVDLIQIGSRNMYNYPLLKRVAATNKPVLLKRHFAATLDEFLLAAEYILQAGNNQVILCERGIRTFESRYRNCLDLSGVVTLKQITHLPIIVDPSHAAGDSSMVEKLALAAACTGADGLMIEVHAQPLGSRSDAPQAITPQQFASLASKIDKLQGMI